MAHSGSTTRIDITRAVRQHLHGEPLPRLPREMVLDEWDWTTTGGFLDAIWRAAQAQQSAGQPPGLVLYDQPGATHIWYVPAAEVVSTLPNAPPPLHELLTHLLAGYRPATQLILVLQTRVQAQVLLLDWDAGVQVLLTCALRSVPSKPNPLRLPPAITVRRWDEANGGITYDFTHATFGSLGRIRLMPRGQDHLVLYTEIVRRDPATDAEREAIFGPVADSVMAQLSTALDTGTPLPEA